MNKLIKYTTLLIIRCWHICKIIIFVRIRLAVFSWSSLTSSDNRTDNLCTQTPLLNSRAYLGGRVCCQSDVRSHSVLHCHHAACRILHSHYRTSPGYKQQPLGMISWIAMKSLVINYPAILKDYSFWQSSQILLANALFICINI